VLCSLAAVDPTLFRALELKPGHRVLDFGCGSGEPSLAIAQLVAPRGTVLGLDIAQPMVEIARRRAKLRGIPNARFRRGDVAHAELEGRFDGAVSRYGLMFVDDVPLALERVRRWLTPGGRLALAVWGPEDRNPFFRVRAASARAFLKEPPPDPERFPSPLRLARPGLLPRLMRRAGFRAVRAAGVNAPLVFRNEDEVFDFTVRVPGPLMRLYDTLSRRDQRELRRRLVRGIRPFRSGGVLRIPGFAWVVSGSR
jgi:SAM-dependent methyltransferase